MQSCSIVLEIKCCRYKPNNIEGSFHLGSQDLLDDFKNKTVCHIKPQLLDDILNTFQFCPSHTVYILSNKDFLKVQQLYQSP